jgi:hypothetical protein
MRMNPLLTLIRLNTMSHPLESLSMFKARSLLSTFEPSPPEVPTLSSLPSLQLRQLLSSPISSQPLQHLQPLPSRLRHPYYSQGHHLFSQHIAGYSITP